MTADSSVAIAADALAAFCTRLLVAAGASDGNARTVVDHLIEADRMGLRSHGVIRIPQYLAEIALGEVDPAAQPQIETLMPGRGHVDGRRGFGQVVGVQMAGEAVRLAGATGIGFVGGRHMGHTGRIGAYAQAIAARGMLGIAVCSGPRSGHWVAPFGGREGRLSTNPIAFACPIEGGSPIVADFSTSVVPEGMVRSLRNRGLTAPEGAIRDAAGRPTTDPADLYAEPHGAIQPIGGAVGYRGTALGILVEILAALLAGDETADSAREGSDLAMIAIVTDGALAGRAARMADYVRSAAPLDPERPVLLPGEREQREAARTGGATVLVDGPTWQAMVRAAGSGIDVPDTMRTE
ncbi:MAG: Ldh family oxidoreductase [Aestuariivirga sp.]